MTMNKYSNALQQYVVMETVVTGECDQPSPSDGHREENLDGRVLPNLYDVKRKILVSSNNNIFSLNHRSILDPQ